MALNENECKGDKEKRGVKEGMNRVIERTMNDDDHVRHPMLKRLETISYQKLKYKFSTITWFRINFNV